MLIAYILKCFYFMSDKHYSREAFRAHQELARKIETTHPCQSYLSVSLPPQKVVLFDID